MTLDRNHRILLIDDNPAIHEDFKKILAGPLAPESMEAAEAILFETAASVSLRSQFQIDSAFQGKEGLEKVQCSVACGRPYALAFVDVRMPPGWDGIETIEQLWRADPALQIVVCTAFSDYSWEKMTSRLGVNENLVILKKPFDNLEVLQLAHALTRKWEVTQEAGLRLGTLEQMVRERTRDLERAHAELRRSDECFVKAFCASPIPFAIHDRREKRFVDVNDAFVQMTGFSRSELIGHTLGELRLCAEYETQILRDLGGESPVSNVPAQIRDKAGAARETLISLEQITIDGEPHVLLIAQDVTERIILEAALRQSQKMEAIGQLAAGVAHDFNNLLTVIEGHASLQLADGGMGKDANESFRQIEQAAERAAELTRQLLAFSRRQIMRPRVLDLKNVILGLVAMLRRLLVENIELRCIPAAALPPVHADQTCLEQIIMNLSLNARDAMPDGGVITITTGEMVVPAEECGTESEARPGHFAWLSVSDTGVGMDEETREHIFEPFFTTKDVNKGTGMGLATVYGIVKQHDGWIDVTTEPGRGSTFRVWLPVAVGVPEIDTPARPVPGGLHGGDHTIFIVEDDDSVRSLVKEIVLSDGYRVFEARNAQHALEVWSDHRDDIELLLTDIVMPGASGLELAGMLLADRSALKVIYTSGYSAELFTSRVPLEDGVNYLPKPYLASKLLGMLRSALEPQTAHASIAAVSRL